jgi:Fe-S cluster assembly protein SufD
MFQERLALLYKDLKLPVEFPNRKVESYRKVPLQAVSSFTPLHKGVETLDISKIPKSIVVLTMKEAQKTYQTFLENRAKQRKKSETDFFAALAESVKEGGYFFYVPQAVQIDEPLEISFQYHGKEGLFTPHIQIYVARGANVRFQCRPQFKNFESGMINQLIDIYLDRDARCDFVDEALISEKALYINSVRMNLKRAAVLNYWNLSKGSDFYKQDFHAQLLEEESEVSIKGAAMLEEKRVSHTNVLIEHKAPNARSNQHFKAVMKDASKSSFEGKIYVEPKAQQTLAYQLNNNLLLGKDSSCFSKPNLEIFADDVKASHGSTVANLSQEELFYFQARGISKEKASLFLASGFLDEIIKDIPAWHLIRNW